MLPLHQTSINGWRRGIRTPIAWFKARSPAVRRFSKDQQARGTPKIRFARRTPYNLLLNLVGLAWNRTRNLPFKRRVLYLVELQTPIIWILRFLSSYALRSPDISSTICVSLCMTVWANQAKVVFRVVIWIAILVIKVNWNRLFLPCCQLAGFASVSTFFNQPRFSCDILSNFIPWLVCTCFVTGKMPA